MSFREVIVTICLICTAPIWVSIWVPSLWIIRYLSPDFETSLVKGYKRPVIGLKLCWRCKVLKYKLWGRATHYHNYTSLRASASNGCWCCQVITEQLATAMEDNAHRPVLHHPSDLKTPRLLMWFADNTRTKSGYLDSFQGLDYYHYVYGQQPRALQTDPSSKASFRLIAGWLEACNLQHQCYQGGTAKLPTRVIDVSKDQPFLMVSKGLFGRYITLSHCWGKHQPLVTTNATLNSRIEGIPVESLPKMFRDAVNITRQLDIQYLWIDSLCIIQDSEEDWSQEAAKMGDVYRYSFLTLFVLHATDCHQRILVPRSQITHNETKPGDVENRYDEPRIMNKQDVFKISPLCHRAWALQERLLSPRVLYYSAEEMFWECLACTAREGSITINAYRPSKYSQAHYECPDVKNRLILPCGESPSLPLSPPSDWHIVVVEYTRCHLTKATDKLPALSGLASIFKANTGYTYLAGLWEEDFRDGLLWFAELSQDNDARHSESIYLGPSWSWVSSRSPVLYVTVTGLHDLPIRSTRDIKLLGSTITHKDANPMGEILGASVTVQADFKRLFYSSNAEGSFIHDKEGRRYGTVFLDSFTNYSPIKKPCTALWVTEREFCTPDYEETPGRTFRPFVWSYFLVIVPCTTSHGTWSSWRRIGLGRCSRRRGLFSGSESAEFNLV